MEGLMKLIRDMSAKIDKLQDEVRCSHTRLGALEESMRQTPHTPQGENFRMGGNRENHNAVVPPRPIHHDNPNSEDNYVPAPGRALPPRAPDFHEHVNFDLQTKVSSSRVVGLR